MDEVRLRTVDAFAESAFSGNPAAVVLLDEAPSDEWMAAVARETNVSDTAFVIRDKLPDADFELRWFTPAIEVDLCGHATLASAHVLWSTDAAQRDKPISFHTRSGVQIATEADIRSCRPDFTRLAQVASRGVIVTARSSEPAFDFVSRFFAPAAG